jgi:hypothetical protein
MCTVTFLPAAFQTFITSNRDESPDRQANELFTFQQDDQHTIHFPLDPLSEGSWIALAESGRVVCLLNGAYEAFIPLPGYRMSRGKVVTTAASTHDIKDFLENFPLHDVAPFTLIVYERPDQLRQLIWDGHKKTIEEPDSSLPHIWSSVTLYPPPVRAFRKSLFDQWLKATKDYDRESIMAFHRMAHGDPANDFVMDRQIVKTLSITSIMVEQNKSSIAYLNLSKNSLEEIVVTHK